MRPLTLVGALGACLSSLPLAVHAQHTYFNPANCMATIQFKVTSLKGPNKGMSRSSRPIRLVENELKDFRVTTLEFPAKNKVRVSATFRVANNSSADRDAKRCPGDGAVSWFIDGRDNDRRFDRANEFTRTTSVIATLGKSRGLSLSRPGTLLFKESATWRTGFNTVGRTLRIVEAAKPESGVNTSPISPGSSRGRK